MTDSRGHSVWRRHKLGVVLVLSLFIHVIFLVLGNTVLTAWRWPHHAVHSSVETVGAVAAIWCAWMLVWLERRNAGTSFNILIAGALAGMGILDGFHAVCHAGNNFVWLHSTATFFGGLLFSLIWLQKWWSPGNWWPWAVTITTTLLASVSLALPDAVPSMVFDGEFSISAMTLNVVGGVLMFAAAARLVWSHVSTANDDDLLFCIHCTLFGLAAIMFEQSALWDFPWWGWHFLRLMAYGFAVALIVLNNPERDIFRLNEELRRHRATLEQTVHERTAKLEHTNRLLKIREKQAQLASRAKTEFLANMSHEIRTPMTAILGYADVLLGEGSIDAIPTDRAAALKTIKRNGEHLLTVINDILDLSKIEAGKIEVEATAASPVRIVNDVVSLMKGRAEEKQISLKVDWQGPVPATVLTDPVRLRQILINLVGNAVKFTERGSVTIRPAYDQDDPCQPSLSFAVVDTGIGMTDEQQGQLFHAFSQADTSTTRKFGGTGLGLVISKRLAELMGGDISVQSEYGVGTTFSATIVTAPLDDVAMIDPRNPPPGEQPEHSHQPTSPASAEPAPADPLANLRILLVEDGPDNQRLIEFVLKKAGADVTIVDNGQLGVEQFTTDGTVDGPLRDAPPYDVVLMDMQMPVMDGYTAAGLLRTKGNRVPVIALTAHAMNEERDKCLAAGCDEFATKPIDRQQLIKLIAEVAAATPAS